MPQTRSDIGSFREVFVNSSCLSAKCPFERLCDIVFNSTDLGELEATDGSLWLLKWFSRDLAIPPSLFTIKQTFRLFSVQFLKNEDFLTRNEKFWMPQRNVTARECWL